MNSFIFKKERTHNNKIPVLMYHEVSSNNESKKNVRHMHPCYSLSEQHFEEQMEFLCQNNYKSLSLNSLFNKDSNYKKAVVITFDDGLEGNYNYAFPILKKYNITATIFIIVSQISSQNYLNWEQLDELCRSGISIQSHTMTHRPLKHLNVREVFYELAESKKIIEEKLDQCVNYLSLPHGSFHPNLLDIAKEIGYAGICSSAFGYVRPEAIDYIVGRIPIKNRHQLGVFKQIISEDWMMVLKYQLFLMITNSLSKMVGINNYRKMYRFLFRIKL
jgi:peptidoglycan/xylan/chitin deacetylase (PgdA/CDA1 family)